MGSSLGPWSAQQSDNNEYEWEIMHNERYIAVVCDEPGYGGAAEDNAHLIAAAPELLEALEMALEWIDSVPQETPLPAMPGFNRDWVNDVIAKATAKGNEEGV